MSVEARLNAIVAVEQDPVRRHERLADRRLLAAVVLAPRVVDAELLLDGAAVPADRLDPVLVRELHLAGDVLLDDELALRVAARLPRPSEMPAGSGQTLTRVVWP